MSKQFLLAILLTVLSLIAVSCTCRGGAGLPFFGPQGAQPSGEPQIFFTADRTSIQPGECLNLQWNVQGEGFFAVELNGQQVNPLGQQQVCPPESTVYNLAVDIGSTMLRREVTVAVAGTVQPQPPGQQQPPSPGQPPQQPQPPTPGQPPQTTPAGCPGAPVFTHFEANPSAITSGQSTTLDWGPVTNGPTGQLVGSVVLTPGNFGQVGSPGSRQVSPTSTTTYTLTATGCGGTATKSVTVVVPIVGTPIPIVPQPSLPIPTPTPPGGGGWSGPGKVTSVVAKIDPSSYTGKCFTPIKWSATITVDGPCTVTYYWEASDGSKFPVETAVFSAAGTQTFSRVELCQTPNFIPGTKSQWSGWLRVNILTPIPKSSNQAPLTITCTH